MDELSRALGGVRLEDGEGEIDVSPVTAEEDPGWEHLEG